MTISEQNALLQSPAVANGIGLFETMLVRRGHVIGLEAHYHRLDASCLSLGFPPVSRDRFHELVTAAAIAAGDGEAALRCVHVATGRDLDDPGNWVLDVSAGPISETTLARRRGATAILLDPSLRRSLPQYKLTSYAASVVGLRRARAAGASEGLFVDGRGHVLEGTATNVFALRGDTLITAGAEVLPGIVRAWTVAAARGLGMEVEERAPTLEELRAGSFLTGSLTTLAPLVAIDGIACKPPGARFRELLRSYEESL